MIIGIAGRDKPHRCVVCWAADDLPRWRRYFPRRCRNRHLTITTNPWRIYGSYLGKTQAAAESYARMLEHEIKSKNNDLKIQTAAVAHLFKKLSDQERFNIQSRRSLCELNDKLTAELQEARAALEQAKETNEPT